MAAAVSSPWGKPGAWALDAEEHESELQQQQQQQQQNAPAELSADFPSLSAAATTKTKKKKAQTLSLAEFSGYSAAKTAPAPQTERLTQEELLALPTGPRQRSAEELENRSKLGGGFKDYGSRSRYGGGEDSSQRWGSSRDSEEGGRRGGGGFGREARDSGPSRADETDNWAATKKPISGGGFERRERGGFFESRHSKADEVDSWASNKAPAFSTGYKAENRFEKRGSFESLSRNRDSSFGNGSESDTWGRKKEGSGGENGGRPRLMLQPRTRPLSSEGKDAIPLTVEKPKAADDSPLTVEKPKAADDSPLTVEKPKAANPFGNARPREEVLAEKGQDWKEIEEKLEAAKIKEVACEKTADGSFGRRSFGKGRYDDPEDRSWRKSPTKSVDEEPAEEKKGNVEEADEQGTTE